MSDDLDHFLQTTHDGRESKRALAVKLATNNLAHTEIARKLRIAPAFVSKWMRLYHERGVDAFRVGHMGSESYLSAEDRQQVIVWIRTQHHWDIVTLQHYLKETFGVEYQSMQSYYDLFSVAGVRWMKTQPTDSKQAEWRWQRTD